VKLFVSWSGTKSRSVAELLRGWLPLVLQDLTVWVSSQDISTGTRWADSVNKSLEEHNFGISVLTAENLVAPWVLFEAGSLAKSVGASRVIPILCGIDSIEMPNHPLRQFQYIKAPQRTELYKLVEALNQHGDAPLTEDRLKRTFEKWYPDFLQGYESMDWSSAAADTTVEPFGPGQLSEVLETVMTELRDLKREITTIRFVQAPLLTAALRPSLLNGDVGRSHSASPFSRQDYSDTGETFRSEPRGLLSGLLSDEEQDR
jgi:hypothetical protein